MYVELEIGLVNEIVNALDFYQKDLNKREKSEGAEMIEEMITSIKTAVGNSILSNYRKSADPEDLEDMKELLK